MQKADAVQLLTLRLLGLPGFRARTACFELPQVLFLIEGADAEVADELTGSPLPFVALNSKALAIYCHNSRNGTCDLRINMAGFL